MPADHPPTDRPGVPPRQHNLQTAVDAALAALAGACDDQLLWLGARQAGAVWELPVLDDTFLLNLPARDFRTASGAAVSPPWLIIALHYLAVSARPPEQLPSLAFADLPGGLAYSSVYRQRVNARLCATAGRTAAALRPAALKLTGRPLPAPPDGLAFDFTLFPRLPVRLLWHAGDEEFGPSATILLPPAVGEFLCIEDIVVLSERLVSRLSGQPFGPPAQPR